MITQEQFRNLELLRTGFSLVPEAKDADPGTAVLVPSCGAAGNAPYKSCTCSAAKKKICRHQRDLARLVPEFSKALETARRQSAKLWELRAAMCLAQLWRGSGRTGEARKLLEPIHGWFTEGLETADLVAARSLLDELAG